MLTTKQKGRSKAKPKPKRKSTSKPTYNFDWEAIDELSDFVDGNEGQHSQGTHCATVQSLHIPLLINLLVSPCKQAHVPSSSPHTPTSIVAPLERQRRHADQSINPRSTLLHNDPNMEEADDGNRWLPPLTGLVATPFSQCPTGRPMRRSPFTRVFSFHCITPIGSNSAAASSYLPQLCIRVTARAPASELAFLPPPPTLRRQQSLAFSGFRPLDGKIIVLSSRSQSHPRP